MAYQLGDIFIGDFGITQSFGARPEVYSARYALKGHNGTDFGCPSMTLILSAAAGFVSEIGFDAGGYGNYVKVVHQGYLTLYAHLNDIVVKQHDQVTAGQLIAHSDNTGFTDGAHLHFGVAPCDGQGNKTQPSNGFSGYIDPMGNECQWSVKNLSVPIVVDQQAKPPVSVASDDFVRMVAQGSNYKVIADYLIKNGLNDYLTAHSTPNVDLLNNPGDGAAGEHIVTYLSGMTDEITSLDREIEDLKNTITGLQLQLQRVTTPPASPTLPQAQTGTNSLFTNTNNSGQTVSDSLVKSQFSQQVSVKSSSVGSFFFAPLEALKAFVFTDK